MTTMDFDTRALLFEQRFRIVTAAVLGAANVCVQTTDAACIDVWHAVIKCVPRPVPLDEAQAQAGEWCVHLSAAVIENEEMEATMYELGVMSLNDILPTGSITDLWNVHPTISAMVLRTYLEIIVPDLVLLMKGTGQ